jgi:hypothetical protein
MRHFAVVALSLVVVLNVQGAGPVRAVSAITPEHLLAALRPREMPQVLDGPDTWWPLPPEFNVGVGDQEPGLRFYVVQGYDRVGGGIKGLVETTLSLFGEEAQAAQAFAGTMLHENDRDGIQIDGPQVGAASRYFTRASNRFKAYSYSTTVRFRLGSLVSRVTAFSPDGYLPGAHLARYTAPIERGVRRLLEGRIDPAPLPRRIAGLLPPASAVGAIGPVLGSTVIPAESWAAWDTSGKPLRIREMLRGGGAAELGLRRYGLAADREHVVEVIVFPFATEAAARAWVRDFDDGVRKDKARILRTGRVGPPAIFAYVGENTVYELQFARGAVAGDVSCFAPFAKTSSVCEAPVRRLAERWFAALPKP